MQRGSKANSDNRPLDYAAQAIGRGVCAGLHSAFQAALRHVRFGFNRTEMKKWKLDRRGAVLIIFLGAVLALASVAGVARWRTLVALRESAAEVAGQKQIEFTYAQLDRRPDARFQPVSASATFTDAAQFGSHLYLAGPAGLFEYDPAGKLLKSYRPGQELPPAPVQQLAVMTGSNTTELLISTKGEGLLIFDGRTFYQLRPGDPALRNITAMLPLSTGNILLGTAKRGLLVWDGKSLRSFHSSFDGQHITALAGDASSLWVATLDNGVFHYRSGQAEHFGEAEGLPDRQVFAIAESGEATYVGTPLGVAEFVSGRFSRRLAEGVFARAITIVGDKLMIGTQDEGVWQVPLKAQRSTGLRSGMQSLASPVQRIFPGRTEMKGRGEVLYAVASDGLYRQSAGARDWQRVLSHENALLTDGNVSALAVDDAGRLVVGYFERGLDIVEPNLRIVRHVEDEHIFCVNRIVFDSRRNTALVATANGLAMLDDAGKERKVLTRADGLIADHVTDVALTDSGMVLATPAGLTFIDAAGTRSLYAFHGLINNHVYALGTNGNEIVAGTLGGISELQGDVIRASFTTANSGLKHNWITAVVRAGDEWFLGTYGAGVQRLEPPALLQTFTDFPAHSIVNPNAMFITQDHVFAGTLANGLLVYNRASGRWHAVTDGLPSLNVTAIARSKNSIYIGTDNGLIRVAEQELEQ
jgi:ligand-binding sensor domain-containing protein